MGDALGVSGAIGAPAGENQAGLWVQQLAGHGGTLGRDGPCRQCSCRWHQVRAVTVAWTWVVAVAVSCGFCSHPLLGMWMPVSKEGRERWWD